MVKIIGYFNLQFLFSKHVVCHAVLNAIMNKNTPSLKGCTLYTTLFPCNKCAQLIIQSGIKKVWFYSDKHENKWYTIAAKKIIYRSKCICKVYCNKVSKLRLNDLFSYSLHIIIQ